MSGALQPLTPIVRIAGRGDGITADGRYVAGAAPGDMLASDGTLMPGPARQAPPCRHFGTCGGCQLQHVRDAAYADFVRDRVVGALSAQHVSADHVRDTILIPPGLRRRAALRAIRREKGVMLGYSGQRSHQIVDIGMCPVLLPEMVALLAPLRALLARLMAAKSLVRISMTRIDQGIDLLLEGLEARHLRALEALSQFARDQGLARLMIDQGDGPECLWEPSPATISFAAGTGESALAVPFPPFAFVQASAAGEAALVACVREAVGDARIVADLFCGLGTFAIGCAGTGQRGAKLYAADAARDALFALKAAANAGQRSIFADHRDLYRKPLQASELCRFDAVILDPPRAGAEEQITQLAASTVPAIAYVSCNPASFARDARVLVAAGYRLSWAQPVAQFNWSTHVELVGAFRR